MHIIKQEMKLEFLVWSGVAMHLVGECHSAFLDTVNAIELLEAPQLRVDPFLLYVQVSADVNFVLFICCCLISVNYDSDQP